MSVIHTASEPVGFIQQCSRCGHVLQDYTNTHGVGDWKPRWWAGNVIEGNSFHFTTDEPANCQAVEQLRAPDAGDSASFLDLFYPIFNLLNKARRNPPPRR